MNIYVGNLPREATEGDLKEAFEAFGEVSTVKIIKDNSPAIRGDLDLLRCPKLPKVRPRFLGLMAKI